MKKIALLSLAVLVLSACSKEEAPGFDGRQELRLASGIEAATRADVQNTQIEENETVWAWVWDAGDGAALYNAEELRSGSDGALVGAEPMYFPQTGNGVDIRALHGELATTLQSDVTAFPSSFSFTVAADQSAGGAAYVQSDLLFATADNVARTKSAVALTFYHMLSKLELKIVKNPEITDAITAVRLDGVAVSGIFTPEAAADLTQQTERAKMIAAGDQTATMILGAAPSVAGSTNDAIVVPQPVGGKKMTFTLASGGELVYTIPEDKKFESGKKHVYTVTLKGTGLSVESTICPWDSSDGETEGEAAMPVVPIIKTNLSQAKIGDYFLSDGTLLEVPEGATLSEELSQKCIGVVFQTDLSRIGQAEKDALGGTAHGLVLSLKKFSELQWNAPAYSPINPEEDYIDTYAKVYADLSGLANTQKIWNHERYQESPEAFLAFKAIADFNEEGFPDNTTGWFMPSAGQLWDVLEILGGAPALKEEASRNDEASLVKEWEHQGTVYDNIDAYFKHTPQADPFYNPRHQAANLWSSSERSDIAACRWVIYGIIPGERDDISVNGITKVSRYDVRPVLAF